MHAIPKEVIIQANKGMTKPLLRVLFLFSCFGSGVLMYTGYVIFTEGDGIFGACVLSCGLLYLLYKIWRYFYDAIINRMEIIKKVEENFYYGDIHRGMNGKKPLNVKIE